MASKLPGVLKDLGGLRLRLDMIKCSDCEVGGIAWYSTKNGPMKSER